MRGSGTLDSPGAACSRAFRRRPNAASDIRVPRAIPTIASHSQRSYRVRSTYRYHDALELPVLGPLDKPSDVPAGVYIEPPGKSRRFTMYEPEFHADPDEVGLFPEFRPCKIVSPPPFIATARNCRMVGFRTILTEDGSFFNDDTVRGRVRQRQFLREFAMPDPLNEETGLDPTGAIDVFTLNSRSRRVKKIRGATVVLSSQEPSNYGSFIFRVLPKFQMLRQMVFDKPVHYLAWTGLPAMQGYLDFVGVPEDRIVQHDPEHFIYDLELAIVPSMRNNQAYLDTQSRELFQQFRETTGSPQQPGMKIYVTRVEQARRGHPRAMLNEEELVERLVKMDFQIVDPAELSAEEQVQAFSSAEMVVGPSGSGMFNVVFCHPGTKVIDIESEPHWIHAHRNLFSSCGLRYGIFIGAAKDRSFQQHHQPFTLNIDALIARIESWS
jgi:capsular polysaccharide biosynthesis protein